MCKQLVLVTFLCSINILICSAAINVPDNLGIIGGHDVSINDVPFMASLRITGNIHFCGASIIHERFLLSAAHCIEENRNYSIVVGTDKVSKGGETYDIEKIIVNKNFSWTTKDYDICLIKLAKNLTFGPKVDKINLADKHMKLKPGTLLNVTGWGSTHMNDNTPSPDLLQVKIPVVSTKKCKKIYTHFVNITRIMLCAGATGKDACQKDSGGPLTLNKKQVGITSFGYLCGEVPGVYTRITSVLSWITNTIEENL